MRAVNLLPAPRAEKRQPDAQSAARSTKTIAIAAGAVLALLVAAVAFAFVQGRSHVHNRQAKLALLQSQVEREEGIAAISAKAFAQAQAQSQDHLAAVTSAASGRTAWDSLLDQLSRVMPQGSWLESLQTTPASTASTTDTTSTTTTPSSSSEGSAVVTSNGLSSLGGSGSAAPVAATFTVTGYARSQGIVANVLQRLAVIPALSDVSLTSTQRTPVGDKNAIQFTIGANVRSPGGNG